jgi:hypothetical protein
MKLLEVLRKGLSFLLMSMGVSSPESKKPRPQTGSDSHP